MGCSQSRDVSSPSTTGTAECAGRRRQPLEETPRIIVRDDARIEERMRRRRRHPHFVEPGDTADAEGSADSDADDGAHDAAGAPRDELRPGSGASARPDESTELIDILALRSPAVPAASGDPAAVPLLLRSAQGIPVNPHVATPSVPVGSAAATQTPPVAVPASGTSFELTFNSGAATSSRIGDSSGDGPQPTSRQRSLAGPGDMLPEGDREVVASSPHPASLPSRTHTDSGEEADVTSDDDSAQSHENTIGARLSSIAHHGRGRAGNPLSVDTVLAHNSPAVAADVSNGHEAAPDN